MIRDGKTWRSEGGTQKYNSRQLRATEGGGAAIRRGCIWKKKLNIHRQGNTEIVFLREKNY